MKKINIKELELHNFKGIRDKKINFENETNIYGANASGKTTIADAFTWLLFNKDTSGRADFNIKTLDENNEVIPQIDHSVKAVIEVDNEIIVLEKTLKEKWTKPRGELEKVFSGNETEYYINDVPKKLKEFEVYIADIIDKDVFKMITNPIYFVSLNWKLQRDMLFKITEGIDIDDMVLQNDKYNDLRELLFNKTTDEVKAELGAKKKKLKTDLDNIPARIDEVEKSKPEPYTLDELNIAKLNNQIKRYEEQIEGNTKGYQEIINKRNELQMKLINDENEYNLKKRQAENDFKSGSQAKLLEINAKIRENNANLVDIDEQRNYLAGIENDLNAARAENIRLKELKFEFDETKGICPTCERELENVNEIREQLEANFNTEKATRLQDNLADGKALVEKSEAAKQLMNEHIKSNELIKLALEQLEQEKQDILTEDQTKEFKYPAYVPDEIVTNEIAKLNGELAQFEQAKTLASSLKSEIKQLEQEIAEEKAKANNNDLIAKADIRIAELNDQFNKNNVAIADIERLQYLLDEFIKEKVNLTENAINKNFLYTKFKMFNQLVNGGVEETCIATYNGVPFNDLNNAMKINIGLDIINALCIYFDITAPIFIDNRESVTEIIKTDSQIVNLIVSSKDETLRIGGIN